MKWSVCEKEKLKLKKLLFICASGFNDWYVYKIIEGVVSVGDLR